MNRFALLSIPGIGCVLAISALGAPPSPAAAWTVPSRAPVGDFDLEIITPHHEDIQKEFEAGFAQAMNRELRIRWIKQGTGELIQLLDAKERAAAGVSFGLDVFFGGGVPDHDLAASRGYLEAVTLPREILDAIPANIAGVKLYDDRRLWFGSALSSFGIIYNKRGLANQKLPEVATWDDLAQPRMFSWVTVADPRKSSSIRVIYEVILQKYGWERGWVLLMQLAANSRGVAVASSQIPNEVAGGDVLAGPCIDFYAYAQMSVAGRDVIGYVNPPGASAITPDPISMLRKPPHRELAQKFIEFVLSPAGQQLWVLPRGAPGGPRQVELCRLPVRPDVCAANADRLVIKDPFREAGSGVFMKLDGDLERRRTTLVRELVGTILVDLHDDLRATWKAMIDGGMKPAALAEWSKPPFTESEGLELAKKIAAGGSDVRRITRGWVRQFADKFQRVRDLSK